MGGWEIKIEVIQGVEVLLEDDTHPWSEGSSGVLDRPHLDYAVQLWFLNGEERQRQGRLGGRKEVDTHPWSEGSSVAWSGTAAGRPSSWWLVVLLGILMCLYCPRGVLCSPSRVQYNGWFSCFHVRLICFLCHFCDLLYLFLFLFMFEFVYPMSLV